MDFASKIFNILFFDLFLKLAEFSSFLHFPTILYIFFQNQNISFINYNLYNNITDERFKFSFCLCKSFVPFHQRGFKNIKKYDVK
jgi:hypothetical protein